MKHLHGTVVTKDANAGTYTVIASMPTLDRDREIIDPGAFNPLPKSVAMHVDHNMSVSSLVGRGRPYYDGATLKIDGKFASSPDAQRVRQLVKEQILDSVSVGFLDPKRRTDDKGVVHITSAELIEVSFVTVPSNREALVLAAKGHRDDSWKDDVTRAKALASVLKAEMLLRELEEDSIEGTIRRAKAALYQAKRKGLNRG